MHETMISKNVLSRQRDDIHDDMYNIESNVLLDKMCDVIDTGMMIHMVCIERVVPRYMGDVSYSVVCMYNSIESDIIYI